MWRDRDYARARLAAWWNGDDPPPRPAAESEAKSESKDAPAESAASKLKSKLAQALAPAALVKPLAGPLLRWWDGQEQLRRRAHAWWIGEVLPEAAPSQPEAPPSAPPQSAAPPPPAPEPVAREEPPPAPPVAEIAVEPVAPSPVEAEDIPDPWSPQRVKVVQWLWGEGYDFPGGAEFILELVRPLHLGGDHAILDLGCGTGSTTRAIASMLGCTISGFESSPALVAVAAAAAEQAELTDKARVSPIRLAKPDLPDRRYDVVLCRMVFGAIPDYRPLLAELDRRLKPGGQLLFTEQVLNEGNSATLALDGWQTAEDRTRHPFTLETVSNDLSQLGYDVRIAEDMSPALRALVVGAWERVAHDLEPGTFASDEVDLLNREMDLWHRRVSAYDSGVLKFVRVLAVKREI